ncbi:MAG: response regulator, partial [Gammaproteobacteria bacterium]
RGKAGVEKRITSIMIVDDSEVSRTLIARSLRAEMGNARITACASASEALGYLTTIKFDLITTALWLPDMDGLDLSRRIRETTIQRYTPIIVVSGDADDRLLREGFAAGVTDYFDKSRGYPEFVGFIKAFTQRNLGLVGRVLYVEDSPTAAEITRRVMETHGLQVERVSTAEQALSLLERVGPEAEPEVDIVITDFFLKGKMTGGDLLHAIRAKLRYSQQELPVLVVTSISNEKKQAEVFHAGANDFVTKPIVAEVLMARVRSLLLIKQQFTALRHQAEEMSRLATTDSLTGSHNRRYLFDHGSRSLEKESSRPVWVYLIDIDHFKKINDNYGHIAGDRVLVLIAQTLQQHFLEEPKPPEALEAGRRLGEAAYRHTEADAIVARFGGEEFAILVPRQGESEALAQAEMLRRRIESLNPIGIPITISLGVTSTLYHPDVSLTRLLSFADQALYAAKEAGRNLTYVYNQHGPMPVAGQARQVAKRN